MTRNEKIVLAIGVWYFFFRKKPDAALPQATTPHPLDTPQSTVVQPDGSEVPVTHPSRTVSAPITPDDDNQPNTPITVDPT